jgi:RNA polymerase-interacting CarD/CdnL/TRCF family regulator
VRNAFRVGDDVFSPHHGPGTVTGREVRIVGDSEREYLTVELRRGGLTLMIPAEGVAPRRLRRVCSPTAPRRALRRLAAEPRPLEGNWRDRQKRSTELLGGGDPLALADLVRDMSHAAQRKRPAAGDRQLCETARELLEAELTVVLGSDAAEEVARRLPEPAEAAR